MPVAVHEIGIVTDVEPFVFSNQRKGAEAWRVAVRAPVLQGQAVTRIQYCHSRTWSCAWSPSCASTEITVEKSKVPSDVDRMASRYDVIDCIAACEVDPGRLHVGIG